MLERTVILIKPDGMEKKLIGQIIDRFERAGFEIIAIKLVRFTQEILNELYSHHRDKPFFSELCAFMMEAPVVVAVLEGESAIQKAFDICGPTDPKDAPVGTIRRDFAESIQRNIIHRSDSRVAAEKEIRLLFTPEEP